MTLSQFFTLFTCSVAFGSIMGAYFGTAEYRIRYEKPLITGQCYCPHCHHALAAVHQIPIAGWIILGGTCYYCKAPISKRYPLIEGGFLLCYGFVFLLLWQQPLLMVCSWFGLVCTALLLRCHGHRGGIAKGLLIFAGYHAVYGGVLLCIYAAL